MAPVIDMLVQGVSYNWDRGSAGFMADGCDARKFTYPKLRWEVSREEKIRSGSCWVKPSHRRREVLESSMSWIACEDPRSCGWRICP